MPECLPIPELTPKQIKRFWAGVQKGDGCWEWTGYCKCGYGALRLGQQCFRAHRVAYFLVNGKCPADLLIRHTCHNPLCCNPEHLISGTQADNMQDKVISGRSSKGEQHHYSVLTEKHVTAIKTKLTTSYHTLKSLAEEYGVSPVTIRRIKNEESWKHIEVAGFSPAAPPPCKSKLIPGLTEQQLQNFWAKVRKGQGDDCWEWIGYRDQKGYGRVRAGAKTFLAHRVSYFLANGKCPGNLLIRHTCHNPRCCNPNHLKSGTHADNALDTVASGRSIKGEQHRTSLLTEESVTAIKIACKTPYHGQVKALTKRYKVSAGAIQNIKAGRSWAHVKV